MTRLTSNMATQTGPGQLLSDSMTGSPARDQRYAPEIVIAFVAAAGTDRGQILGVAERLLRQFDYEARQIRISTLIEPFAEESIPSKLRDRAWLLQDVGNRICRDANRADSLALLAVEAIGEMRLAAHRDARRKPSQTAIAPQTAYLIWSLKRPAEVRALRAIYGPMLFVIAVHTPYQERVDRIAQEVAGHVAVRPDDSAAAVQLLSRDQEEAKASDDEFGQDVADTYPLADFIVDGSSPTDLEATMSRSLSIIFGDPFATPTRSEYGMFLAHAGGLKSAELGRQVGAALLTKAGDVIAIGTNDIPRPMGGHYWHGDPEDDREFVHGSDTSDRLRRRLMWEIVEALQPILAGADGIDSAAIEAALATTRVQDLIEYGRAVHAEMSAMLDAARLGVAIGGSIASVTTFPCHLCSRMLIAAGVTRVEYMYPYPKSLATELYRRTIRTTGSGGLDTVPFLPFIGVAPRRYADAFSAPARRKDKTGVAVPRYAQSPRLTLEDEAGKWDVSGHLAREQRAVEIVIELKRAKA